MVTSQIPQLLRVFLVCLYTAWVRFLVIYSILCLVLGNELIAMPSRTVPRDTFGYVPRQCIMEEIYITPLNPLCVQLVLLPITAL